MRPYNLLLWGMLMGQTALAQEMPKQKEVLQSMRLANTYFMNKWPDPGKEIVTNIPRPSHIWTRAVYYEGLMALYSIDPQQKYYDYAADWGEKHQWTPRKGITDRNADDQCCGQTYVDLYGIDPRPERIEPMKACMDNMVSGDKCDDWHWIDAIQMAMPVFTRLGVMLKDTSYFRKMYDLYHYTKYQQCGNGLYNAAEHLWWRDKDFVPPYKEPNGQNCYWSRGNGWVLAALVRVLSLLPVGDPHRQEYLQDYLDMVQALTPLQRGDGYWNASLHDSTHYGGKELTGTALFTYGISWGIRQGYLDKKRYAPIVAAAWNAMVRESLHDNGFLGYVQGTGKQPSDGQPVTYDKVPDFEDYGLGCFLLAGSELYLLATPRAANLDEKLVPPYTEPDVLAAADGRRVTTVKEWETSQRPYLYGLFEKNVYGRMPAAKVAVEMKVLSVDSSALGGLAIRKEVTLNFSGGEVPGSGPDTAMAVRLNLVLYLPRKGGRAPVFVGYNFGGNGTVEQSSQWPLKEILSRGYGVATAWYWDIEPDRPDGWQTGIRTRLAGALQIEPYEWCAIGGWAWGLSRMADYLVTDKQVDPRRLIVIGHSRLGKAALWAGANDTRFASVVSNESGEGGAALSKRDYGETIAIINAKFPWWFAPAYKRYGDDPAALPLDQHMLLSLIAPRPLYVASAEGDQWSDPKGEFLSMTRAGAVYGLYKKKGSIHYHIRPGKHDITLYDWEQYMHFADQYLTGAEKEEPAARVKYNFNPGWKLFVGDPARAEAMGFDDSRWQAVTLPHAFNEDDAFRKAIQDLTTGVAWYRKHFRAPAGSAGRKLFLEFEGIRQAGEFYLNGQWIGRHENGVMAFGFDVTDKVRQGEENVLAVRIDNSWTYKEKATNTAFEWNDRNFYANYGGINKNVYLHVMGRLYQTLPLYSSLGTTGVYVYAKDLDIAGGSATVAAVAQVKNEYEGEHSFRYKVYIRELTGGLVAALDGGAYHVPAGGMLAVTASGPVKGLHWWSWGYGYLYNVSTVLQVDGQTADSIVTTTGFRKTEFAHGRLLLNGRTIQVKGYAQRTTNEWPAVGSSVPAWLSDLSNRLMVESNANLVRWMHVTPWKQDIESCDRVGLMEAMPAGDAEKDVDGRRWEQRVELMRDAIIYNRNDPSIIFYECGNKGISEEHMRQMKQIRDEYDPCGGRAIGAREMLGSQVAEYGGEMLYINKSAAKPLWAMEYSRDEGLRKYWDEYSPPYHKDGDGPLYKGEDASMYNRNQDSHAIEDVARWYDYWRERPGTGERVSAGGVNIIFSESNTHYRGAENYRRSGEVDAMRIPKDGFYAHQVIWDGWVDIGKPRIHIIGHWNYAPGVKKNIYVVANVPKVQLYVNGRSMGWGEPSNRFLFTFHDVTWEPGVISAIGYGDGETRLCEDRHETAGPPAAIRLTPHTRPGGLVADGADLAMVEVEVVDGQGRRCPTNLSMIHFDLEGPAHWRGGIAQGPDNYILSKDLPVECGVNRVLLRADTNAGRIRLQAGADGLQPAAITLGSRPFRQEDGLSLQLPNDGLLPDLEGPKTLNAISSGDTGISRTSLKITGATAGANADRAALSYDDNETTEWSNDGQPASAWIEYRLEKPAAVKEVELKLNNFRTRSYNLRIRVGEQEVFRGLSDRTLGYWSVRFPPHQGQTVRIELVDGSGGQLGITEAEIYK